MNLSPLIRRSGIAVVLFGAAVAVHFALQQRHAIAPAVSTQAIYLACVILVGLGWIGLGELRAQGKRSEVRTLQVITVVLALPMLVMPGARNLFAVCAAAVVVFAAFPLALWHRRERRVERH